MEDRKLTEEEKAKQNAEWLKLIPEFAVTEEAEREIREAIETAKADHKEAVSFGNGKWKHIKIKDQSDEIENHYEVIMDTIQTPRKAAKMILEANPLTHFFHDPTRPQQLGYGLAIGYAIKGLIEGSNIPEAVKELKSAKEVLLKFEEMDGMKEEVEAIDGLLEIFKMKRYADWIPFAAIAYNLYFTPNQAYSYAKRIITKEINEKSFKRFYKEYEESNDPTKAKE